VSRKAGLYGSQNIVLSGKVFVEPGCIIRGDLAHVRVGRYTIVKSRTILRPSLKHFNKGRAIKNGGTGVFVECETFFSEIFFCGKMIELKNGKIRQCQNNVSLELDK